MLGAAVRLGRLGGIGGGRGDKYGSLNVFVITAVAIAY